MTMIRPLQLVFDQYPSIRSDVPSRNFSGCEISAGSRTGAAPHPLRPLRLHLLFAICIAAIVIFWINQ